MKRIAVYPGAFDPITNGHLDLIKRGLRLFDHLIVAVTNNPGKQAFFSIDERLGFIKESTKDLPGSLEVDDFNSLLVDYLKKTNACVVLRGLRAVSDFEYEFQMALMNRYLFEDFETVFMMPSVTYAYLSSRLVREVASFGGDITGLVPDIVRTAFRQRTAG